MKWMKGQSGNPKGRPREAAAIAGLARNQVQKHKLVEKLGRIGAGKAEYSKVDADLQIRAIQLLLSYGYGPARSEHESGETLAIQVNYVERNRAAINGVAPRANAGAAASETVQCGLLRAPLGEDGSGNGSPIFTRRWRVSQ
jgi:hypothetical protein